MFSQIQTVNALMMTEDYLLMVKFKNDLQTNLSHLIFRNYTE